MDHIDSPDPTPSEQERMIKQQRKEQRHERMRRDQQRAETAVLQEDSGKLVGEQKRLEVKAAQMKGYLEVRLHLSIFKSFLLPSLNGTT